VRQKTGDRRQKTEVVLLLFVCLLFPVCALAQATHLLIVVGLPGDPEHGELFKKWGTTLASTAIEKLQIPKDHVTLLQDQAARGLLECPLCASKAVRKQIMAPAVAGTRRTVQDEDKRPTRAMMLEAMGKLRQHVQENFDDVGDGFAKEARAIHEGRAEARGIYGQATPTEVKELVEDGVPVAPLPPEPPKKKDLN